MAPIVQAVCPDCNAWIRNGKAVHYCRATRDFAVYFDHRFIGYRGSQLEAETLINEYVYDLLANALMTGSAVLAWT